MALVLLLVTASITIGISTAFAADYGISYLRIHPRIINPGMEVAVNVMLTGEFTDANPIVAIFFNGEKVADNAELAKGAVSLAPGFQLKFVADERFTAGRQVELKAVMYYQGKEYTYTYYPDSVYKDLCADAPWRVQGWSANVPVEVTIFDADMWSCELDWIQIKDANNNNSVVASHDFGNITIDDPRWSYIFNNINVNNFVVSGGYINILVHMRYWEMIFFSYDFYQYLRIKVANEPLPDAAGWYYGDTHYHTSYTDNYYEEGGSFPMIARCGAAIGLDWTTTNDHASNNSGNQAPIGEFANDLQTGEWTPLGDSCSLNSTSSFKIIRGEEVTVKNDAAYPGDDGTNDNSAHLLTMGNSYYIEGPVGPDAYFEDGDHSNLKSLTSRLQLLQGQPAGIAYAAHQSEAWPVPVFEDIIPWSSDMFSTALGFSSFKGIELYNERNFFFTNDGNYIVPDEYVNPFPVFQAQADWDSNLVRGVALWDSLLCTHLNPIRKVFAAGGSDAHGDFNYRYTGLTLLFYSNIQITDDAFGKVRTAVYCPNGMGQNGENVINALANGVSVVTDGPFIIFGIDADGNGSVFGPHDAVIGGTATPPSLEANPRLVSYWKSTSEFGPIQYVKMIVGSANGTTTYTQALNNYSGYISFDLTRFVPQGQSRFYFRLEAQCPNISGYPSYRCITNPVWVDLTAKENTSAPKEMTEADRIMDNLLFKGTER